MIIRSSHMKSSVPPSRQYPYAKSINWILNIWSSKQFPC